MERSTFSEDNSVPFRIRSSRRPTPPESTELLLVCRRYGTHRNIEGLQGLDPPDGPDCLREASKSNARLSYIVTYAVFLHVESSLSRQIGRENTQSGPRKNHELPASALNRRS